MEFLTALLPLYTERMNAMFAGNEFLIGLVTTGFLGYLVVMLRGIPKRAYYLFLKHCTTEVYIDSTQQSYYQLMRNINAEGVVKTSRFLTIQNGLWGSGKPTLQLGGGSQFLWYEGVLCLVTVSIDNTTTQVVHKLQIRTLGRSHIIANKMVKSCETNPDATKTLVINTYDDRSIFQDREFMSGRVSSDEELAAFNHIKNFTENEKWYKDRGIPYKLGVVIAGPPGTGKTSLVRAIAGELEYALCVVTSFVDFKKIPTDRKCIVLIDELDSAVSSRGDSEDTNKSDTQTVMERLDDIGVETALKAMDGAYLQEGLIIIGTTNFPNRIDPAMKRHGRFGKTITLGYVNKEIFIRTVKRYYEVDITLTGRELKQCSAADLQGKFCEQLTLQEFINYFTKTEQN